MNDIITLEDHLSSSGKYPERMTSEECTDQVKSNAKDLLLKLNPLLIELGLTKCVVSSGFRTQAANSATNNAAPKSNHMIGSACDVQDLDGSLKKLTTEEILIKYGLYCESFDSTPTWVHYQNISPKSGRRFFNP